MTLDQLEMIEAIISEGSYQAAARKIHKAQPSLSNGVKKIEELYGIQIFSREGYRPVLTDVGRKFYENAKTTLASYRHLHKVATELGAGVEPQIKISVDPIVMSHHLNSFFEVIKEHNYQTTLMLESGILQDNVLRLQEEKIDFAVGLKPQTKKKNIEAVKLNQIELVPVIHKSLIQDKTLNNTLLNSLPNIIVKSMGEDEPDVPIESDLKWYVDTHTRKTEFIEMGVGWGRLARSQFNPNSGLIEIPKKIAEPFFLDIYLMRNLHIPYGPVGQRVWKEFQS